MISYRLTSCLLGFLIAFIIVILIRRGHLHIMHSIWWFFIGLMSVIFGSFPWLINWIAPILGIHYPPNFILIGFIFFFIIKLLKLDIERSEQDLKIRTLTERLAILEEKINL